MFFLIICNDNMMMIQCQYSIDSGGVFQRYKFCDLQIFCARINSCWTFVARAVGQLMHCAISCGDAFYDLSPPWTLLVEWFFFLMRCQYPNAAAQDDPTAT